MAKSQLPGKGRREEKLANLLNMPIEEVFKNIPIPENPLELAHRINKKKALGLDVTIEESIRKARQLENQIIKVQEEIKTEPLLLPEQLEKLVGLVKGVINELQTTAA